MTQPWSAQNRWSVRIRPWNERSGRIWAGPFSVIRNSGGAARGETYRGHPGGSRRGEKPSPGSRLGSLEALSRRDRVPPNPLENSWEDAVIWRLTKTLAATALLAGI